MAARWLFAPVVWSTDRRFWTMKHVYDKVINPTADQNFKWSARTFGFEDIMFGHVDDAHPMFALFQADPQCLIFPANLDNNLTNGAINTASTFLSAYKVPTHWLNNTLTYRQVRKVFVAICFVAGVIRAAIGEQTLFQSGITLATEWQQLPKIVSTLLYQRFQLQGYPVELIQPTTTIRQIIRFLAQRWDDKKISMGGEVL